MYNLRSRKKKRPVRNCSLKKRSRYIEKLGSSSSESDSNEPNERSNSPIIIKINGTLSDLSNSSNRRSLIANQLRLIDTNEARSEQFRVFLEARLSLASRRNAHTEHMHASRDIFQPRSAPDIFLTPFYNGVTGAHLVLLIPDNAVENFIRINQDQLYKLLLQNPRPLPSPDEYLRLLTPWSHYEASVTVFLWDVPPVRIPLALLRREGGVVNHLISVHVLNYNQVYYEVFDQIAEETLDEILSDIAHNILRHVARRIAQRLARQAHVYNI